MTTFEKNVRCGLGSWLDLLFLLVKVYYYHLEVFGNSGKILSLSMNPSRPKLYIGGRKMDFLGLSMFLNDLKLYLGTTVIMVTLAPKTFTSFFLINPAWKVHWAIWLIFLSTVRWVKNTPHSSDILICNMLWWQCALQTVGHHCLRADAKQQKECNMISILT